jgi:predicted ThiF/HesA family dinucleotide-utilizing enzyme
VKSGSTKSITFKLTNLAKKPVKGTTVTFETFGEGNELETWSEISDAKGTVSVNVRAAKGTDGLQVVRAHVFGAPKGTDAKIYWTR